jgi:RimJ/RimL family protein N-acetyltransferase
MTVNVVLRDVTEADIPLFFEIQLDPVANRMVAFTVENPADLAAFTAKWTKILADDRTTKQTVLADGCVAGSVLCYEQCGKPEVGYWIAREHWGRGIATRALSEFLGRMETRPLYARAAKDNRASLRVLEKCGFTIVGEDKGFSHARGMEVEEFVLELRARATAAVPLDRFADLSDADREAVRALSQIVYPPEQHADWPGRHLEWAIPEWCVRVRGEDGSLVSFVGVYVRDGSVDGRPVRLGGIGNVKTHPTARKRGFAGAGIRRAVEFFGEQGVEFALLVCEPYLLGYYARLGWQEFGGGLRVTQFGAATDFTLNRAMVLSVRGAAPLVGTMDLLGPPW